MAGFATTLRTARANANKAAIEAGTGAGQLKIYNGTRPSTGGTATTLLCTVTLADPVGTVTSGVLTFGSVAAALPVAAGTATWGRITDSDDAFVMDISVGTSGTECILSNATLATDTAVAIQSVTITEGDV